MGCATILGQAIGRWGNYFNSEAYGLPIIGQNWGLFIPEGKRILNIQIIHFSILHFYTKVFVIFLVSQFYLWF